MSQGLQGVAVGDPVIIHDVSMRRIFRGTVAAIGRKYATIGREKYALDTGRIADSMGHRCAYTPAQWARSQAEDRLREACRVANERRPLVHLTDADVLSLAEQMEIIVRRLEGE